MFKKTVIAAALAATTGVAMADVSVSGKVEQTFTNNDAATGNKWVAGSDVFVKFAASEDLGNGMKAFAHIVLDADQMQADSAEGATAATAQNAVQDTVVGVSGGFGTVMAGRFEAFVEGKLASTMSMTGQVSVEDTSASHAGRNNGGIAYVSPTVNGFHVGVGGYALGTAAQANFDDGLDATEVALIYSNGPISVSVAQQNIADATADALNVAEKTTAIAASYTAGDLKVSYLRMENDNIDVSSNANDDRTDNMYRLDYTMGNNKITLAHSDDETTNGAAGNDNTAIELVHRLSKHTQVYVGMTDRDTANTDTSYVGIQHAF